MIKISRTLILVLAFVQIGVAQQVENVAAQRRGDKIIIRYHLSGAGKLAQVSIFSSIDSFTTPLKNATGDVGDYIEAGDKRIIVKIDNEMASYDGDFSFRVSAKEFNPIFQLNNFTRGASFKRGRNYLITWNSEKQIDKLRVELLDGDKIISDESQVPNNGNYNWHVPKALKPKGGYRFKITSLNNESDVTYSRYFCVKRRLPLALKIGSSVAAGAAVLLIWVIESKSPPDF